MPQQPPNRIPDLPIGKIVNEEGEATDVEQTFRQNLVTGLTNIIGNEGIVAPTQTAADITIIQNNTTVNPSGGAAVPTCQYGTFIYDSTNNRIVVTIDNGAGSPIFKEVVLI